MECLRFKPQPLHIITYVSTNWTIFMEYNFLFINIYCVPQFFRIKKNNWKINKNKKQQVKYHLSSNHYGLISVCVVCLLLFGWKWNDFVSLSPTRSHLITNSLWHHVPATTHRLLYGCTNPFLGTMYQSFFIRFTPPFSIDDYSSLN